MGAGEAAAPSAWLRSRVGSWRAVRVFGLVYLVSQVCIGVILHDIGSLRVLQLQTTLSRPRFEALFAQLRQEQLLDVYASHYYFDVVHPLWYGLALAALLAKALDAGDSAPRWNGVLYVPLLGGLLDVIENAVHLHYLATGATTDGLVLLGGIAAGVKWVLVTVAMAIAAWLFMRARGGSRLQSRKAKPR